MGVKKQTTKRQHFIPRLLLKRFTRPNTNKLFVMDDEKKVVEERTPNGAGWQRHLYTVHYEDAKDYALEEWFSRIENEIEPVLDKMLIPTNANSEEDIQKLLEFVSILSARTPKFAKLAEDKGTTPEMGEILYKKGIEKGLPIPAIKDYIELMSNAKGFTFAQTFRSSFMGLFGKIVANFNPILAFSKTATFVVSDNYATFEPFKNFQYQDHMGTAWEVLPIYIHCPIAANVCLTFTPKEGAKKGSNDITWSKRFVDAPTVKRINGLTINQRARYLYGPDDTILKASLL